MMILMLFNVYIIVISVLLPTGVSAGNLVVDRYRMWIIQHLTSPPSNQQQEIRLGCWGRFYYYNKIMTKPHIPTSKIVSP